MTVYHRPEGMLDGEFIRKCMEALEDKGYSGAPVRYLLCRRNGEVEFIAKVTPDPDWSFQKWETASGVQFTNLPQAKGLWYEVDEIDGMDYDTHVAFETYPVYDVDGREMMGGD